MHRSAPMSTDAPTAAVRYWAFLSYSHQDERWARWLHRALETYRVPRRLVGRPLRDETVPPRLFPVFRDREELPSAHELGAVLQRALDGSRNLVVICSPRSAASRWVDEEIRRFRAQGGGDRIHCLIVDGEPHAADPARECFAPALREPGIEPIAADARDGRDGRAEALLKLVAGLIGVGLDELRQRDRQRRFWQRVQLGVAAALLVALFAGGLKAWQADREARAQAVRIDKLLESGRRELLDGQQARAAVYLAEAYRQGRNDAATRFLLAQALQPVDALLPVRIAHGDQDVRAAAFSADGRIVALATVGARGAVATLFDARSGRRLQRFEGLPQAPRLLRFTPDGQRLLVVGYTDEEEAAAETLVFDLAARRLQYRLPGESGRLSDPGDAALDRLVTVHDGAITVWRVVDGRVLSRLDAGAGVTAAALSPDGSQLAYARRDGSVQQQDLAGRRLPELTVGVLRLGIAGLRYTGAGDRLVIVGRRGDVRVWDLRRRGLHLAFAADETSISDIQLSADGQHLLTVGWEGYKVWDLRHGLLEFSERQVLRARSSAQLSPDGEQLVVVDHSSSVAHLWDIPSQRELLALDWHAGSVRIASFSGDGSTVLTASVDGTARLWRTDARLRWSRQVPAPYRIEGFARSPDGQRVFAAATVVDAGEHLERDPARARGYVLPFETASGQAGPPWPQLASGWSALEVSADGRWLAGAHSDGRVSLWSAADGRLLAQRVLAAGGVRRVRFTPGGERLLALPEAGATTAPQLLELPGLGLVRVLEEAGTVLAVGFEAAGGRFVTGSQDGRARLWDSISGRLLQTLEGHGRPVYSARFDRAGRQVLTVGDDNSLRTWAADSGAPQRQLQDPALRYPNTAMFDEAGAQVAVGDWSGKAWLWSVDGRLRPLAAHGSSVVWVQFLAGDALLATASTDGRVLLWDALRAELLGALALHGEEIRAQVLDEAGQRLLSLDGRGRLRAWSFRLEDRDAARVAELLACRVPWTLVGEGLERRALGDGACS